MNILNEADQITGGDRQRDYGHPRDNHARTAALWTAYLELVGATLPAGGLTARQVCWLNILQKISRDVNAAKRDNLTDVAGFARNIEMIDEAQQPVERPTYTLPAGIYDEAT